MKYLLLLLLLILLAGCAPRKPIMIERTVKDTVTITETITTRDTLIISDTAKASLSVAKCEDIQDTLKITNKQASLKLYKDKETGALNAECECDTLQIKAELRDKMRHEKQVTVTTETQIVKERYVPAIVKLLAWIGGLGVGGILFMIIKKLT